MSAQELIDEGERVFKWRQERFMGLGFEWTQARVLADTGADYHEAERLLAMGCPHRLVFRLLA